MRWITVARAERFIWSRPTNLAVVTVTLIASVAVMGSRHIRMPRLPAARARGLKRHIHMRARMIAMGVDQQAIVVRAYVRPRQNFV